MDSLVAAPIATPPGAHPQRREPHVLPSHIQPCYRAYLSTSRCPTRAAAGQVDFICQAEPFAIAQTSCRRTEERAYGDPRPPHAATDVRQARALHRGAGRVPRARENAAVELGRGRGSPRAARETAGVGAGGPRSRRRPSRPPPAPAAAGAARGPMTRRQARRGSRRRTPRPSRAADAQDAALPRSHPPLPSAQCPFSPPPVSPFSNTAAPPPPSAAAAADPTPTTEMPSPALPPYRDTISTGESARECVGVSTDQL
jgi:hypothetical protein